MTPRLFRPHTPTGSGWPAGARLKLGIETADDAAFTLDDAEKNDAFVPTGAATRKFEIATTPRSGAVGGVLDIESINVAEAVVGSGGAAGARPLAKAKYEPRLFDCATGSGNEAVSALSSSVGAGGNGGGGNRLAAPDCNMANAFFGLSDELMAFARSTAHSARDNVVHAPMQHQWFAFILARFLHGRMDHAYAVRGAFQKVDSVQARIQTSRARGNVRKGNCWCAHARARRVC